MRPLSTSTVATCYYFRSARLVSNKVSVEVVSMQEFMMTTRVNNVCDDTAEDAVHDAVETELVALQTGSGDDELVEMSSRRCWSSRSTGQSWSALVRAGQHGSELVGTGQSWSALVRAGQYRSELVGTGQSWSARVRAGQHGSELVSTGQSWSALVRAGQRLDAGEDLTFSPDETHQDTCTSTSTTEVWLVGTHYPCSHGLSKRP